MPLNFAWIADVATESDVPNHPRAHIVHRNGTATVSRNGVQLEQKAGVVAVEQPDSRSRLLRFDDGTAWVARLPARKPGGCGCS